MNPIEIADKLPGTPDHIAPEQWWVSHDAGVFPIKVVAETPTEIKEEGDYQFRPKDWGLPHYRKAFKTKVEALGHAISRQSGIVEANQARLNAEIKKINILLKEFDALGGQRIPTSNL